MFSESMNLIYFNTFRTSDIHGWILCIYEYIDNYIRYIYIHTNESKYLHRPIRSTIFPF